MRCGIGTHDKLKPCEIAINGCTDGFSRYVVWMEANRTNDDPKVTANYFIMSIARLGGCPAQTEAQTYFLNIVF